jgi:hypothetical protein
MIQAAQHSHMPCTWHAQCGLGLHCQWLAHSALCVLSSCNVGLTRHPGQYAQQEEEVFPYLPAVNTTFADSWQLLCTAVQCTEESDCHVASVTGPDTVRDKSLGS